MGAPSLPNASADPEPSGGWALVVALAICQLVSWGSLYNGFVLFVVPMEREFGWSREAINGAVSLGLLVMGLCAFGMGRWIDLRGGRWLMTAGSMLAGVLCLMWAGVETLAGLYAIWLGMGIAMAAMLYQALFAVLTRTYRAGYRTRITVVTLVAGFASTVFIPLTQALIEGFGWRATLVVFAAIQILLCAPIHGLWLRDGRGPSGRPMTARSRAATGIIGRAVRQPTFWGLALCFTATAMVNSVIWFHAVPMFAERGFTTLVIVTAIALIGPVQVAGRLVVFAVGRRVSTATQGRLALTMLPAVFVPLLLWPGSVAGLYGFTVMFGAVNGVMTIVRATAVAEFLGLEGYGAISGLISVPATVAHAGSPFAIAFLWGWFGGYDIVVTVMFLASILAAAAFWFAASEASPARR
ncbi:MAG: MFS transporter [Alphaproteobacteria bacterium]|nr:MFS transporter [Alphaproteobacteria bacterium]